MDLLVDKIYDAAIAPQQWPTALAALAERFGAKGGLLFASTAGETRWTGSGQAAEVMREFVAQGWMDRNDRMMRLIARRHAGFLTDLDLFSAAEIGASPVYTQFLTPRGFSASAATSIAGAGDDTLILSIEGFRDHTAASAAAPALDLLRPHLTRAAVLSARLQLEKAKATVAALEGIGSPAALVGRRGALIAANALFESEIAVGFTGARGGFRLADERADYRLHEALENVRLGLGGASIAIRGDLRAQARALHVLPVAGKANDLFSSASAVLVVTSRKSSIAPSGSLLEQLYDLSPAEARIARALTDGLSLREIADRSKTSIHTVRNQFKAVLEKTGADGQSHLTKLLLGLTLPSDARIYTGS